jgi:ATP-binding cassette subfamily F protein uup
VDWPGTLLLVSHDRAFLDHVVTSTIVFEGDGHVQEYVGGYEDWVRQRPGAVGSDDVHPAEAGRHGPAPGRHRQASDSPAGERPRKLSYKEQRELHELPRRIEVLEVEKRTLAARMAAPDFYKEPAQAIEAALARAGTIEDELVALYERWDALDSRVT